VVPDSLRMERVHVDLHGLLCGVPHRPTSMPLRRSSSSLLLLFFPRSPVLPFDSRLVDCFISESELRLAHGTHLECPFRPWL
jgi:hypothetical protein